MLIRRCLGVLIAMALWFGFNAPSAIYASAQQAAPTVRTIPLKSLLYGAKLSPDGRIIAVFENRVIHDKEQSIDAYLPIHLFDLATGTETTTLTGATDYAADLAFSPDGKRLVSYHTNGLLLVWDIKSRKIINQFVMPFLGDARLKFSSDGRSVTLLVSNQLSYLVVVDSATGYITRTLRVLFPTFAAFQNIFSGSGLTFLDYQLCNFENAPDGKMVATVSISDEVTLWELSSGKTTTVHPASEKKGGFESCALTFTPDGKSLVYFDGTTGKTRFWDVKAGKEIAALDLGSLTFALSPNGKSIAWLERKTNSTPAKMRVALIAKPDAISDVELPAAPVARPRISSLAFTPDSNQLVLGGLTATDSKNALVLIGLKP